MANYCEHSDVGVLLNKSFDATSTPTSTQVTTIITQITGEIDTILYSIGINSQPTDANILAMLEKYSAFGSAGITGISYFRNASNIVGSNAEWYYKEYKEFLEKLREDPEILGIVIDSESLIIENQVLDGTYTEDDMESIMIANGDYEF